MKFAARSGTFRAVWSILTIGALTIGIGACGSDEAGDQEAAAEPVVDVSKLDVGPYSTEPKDWGVPTNLDQARAVEAERLANFVPPMSDVDPKFVHSTPFWSNVFIEPDNSLDKIIAAERFDEAAPDLVAGFLTVAGSKPENMGIDLLTAVMIFPDEQAAVDSAAALERVDFEHNPANERIELPSYPAAHNHWIPGEQSIGSWLAVGKLVIYTWVYDYLKTWADTFDGPALISLAEKALDTVVPEVSKFRPTPQDELMQAPVDVDGMLGRTLKFNVDDELLNPPGAYDGRTYIHFASSPEQARRIVEEFDVEKFVDSGFTTLYRTRDAAAAKNLNDEIGGLTKSRRRIEGPSEIPQAKCSEYIGRERAAVKFYCSVYHGRYVANIASEQALDLHQRVSAQYALLVNAE